jgi:hypothetical protein
VARHAPVQHAKSPPFDKKNATGKKNAKKIVFAEINM